MITLIVPTFNRAYALKQVLDTFYTQEDVSEVIFIDDCSEDDTKEVVDQFSKKYPEIQTKYFRNNENFGASYGRKLGYQQASNEYVMYCDDDEFLGELYAKTCLEKLLSSGADVVSGRHFYREVGESFESSLSRFGDGLNNDVVFDKFRFQIKTDSIHRTDIEVPFTHAIFLTKKSLLEKYSFDVFYSKGNGFREESDFQLNLFCNGGRILVTNDVHCIHMNLSEVKSGGQRVSRLERFYWTLYYTNYFMNKYFYKVRDKLNIRYPLWVGKGIYFILTFDQFFIRPFRVLLSRGFK
ncbi:glycosyltransferase family 2 protein [Halobacteriovorax sp. HLS]|uniref:glycosyltransferase family 2 protein n=1 Tax=Halobacteriovorax sp. HLS TaxID=2234000 RepID=UPI000FD7876E|nr:glycosyltransferase family 2 protein [Halobacteriovorax sp. HLS]